MLSGGDLYRIVRLEFAGSDAVKAALGSPEGQAAAQDLANFADGGVQIVAFDEIAGVRRVTMDVRAAVAFEAGKPLEIVNVQLEGPEGG